MPTTDGHLTTRKVQRTLATSSSSSSSSSSNNNKISFRHLDYFNASDTVEIDWSDLSPKDFVTVDKGGTGRAIHPCQRPALAANQNLELCWMFDELIKYVRHSPYEEFIKTEGQQNAQRLTAYSRVRAVLRAFPIRIDERNVDQLKDAHMLGEKSYSKIIEALQDEEGFRKGQPLCRKLHDFMFSGEEEFVTARALRNLCKVHGVGKSVGLRWFRDYHLHSWEQARNTMYKGKRVLEARAMAQQQQEQKRKEARKRKHTHSSTTTTTTTATTTTTSSTSSTTSSFPTDDVAVHFLNNITADHKIALKYFEQINEHMQRQEKEYFLDVILQPIFDRLSLKFELVGGMRRVKPGAHSTHHDIDVLVTLNDEESCKRGPLKFIPAEYQQYILQTLRGKKHIIHEFSGGITSLSGVSSKIPEKKHVTSLLLMKNETGIARRIDIVVVPPEHWCFARLGWSGSTEMEKSWKHYTKHFYKGRPGEVDEQERLREWDGNRCRWYLSNSRLCYAEKRFGEQVLDFDAKYEEEAGTYTSERDIFQGLGLPWLEPWQRCA